MICCCNDTATTEIYTYGHTLSRHDALPSCSTAVPTLRVTGNPTRTSGSPASAGALAACRTKPGVTHLRRAPATFRNWGRVLSRPTVGIMTARRKGACGPWRADGQERDARQRFPCVRGTRGGACEPAHWADRCASRLNSNIRLNIELTGLYKGGPGLCQRPAGPLATESPGRLTPDRKSTRLNSSH